MSNQTLGSEEFEASSDFISEWSSTVWGSNVPGSALSETEIMKAIKALDAYDEERNNFKKINDTPKKIK